MGQKFHVTSFGVKPQFRRQENHYVLQTNAIEGAVICRWPLRCKALFGVSAFGRCCQSVGESLRANSL